MSSRVQLVTPCALRIDSRLPLECRTISIAISPSPQSPPPPTGADGHATIAHGLTRVSATVFGPREPIRIGPFSSSSLNSNSLKGAERAVVNVEVGVAAWSEKNLVASSTTGIRKGGRDRRIAELASAIKSTFEPVLLLHLYPRSAIDLYLQIHSVDGSLLQAAINATTLALISAGLPLADYVCALSLASYPSLTPSGPPQIVPFESIVPAVPHSNASNGASGSGSTTLVDLCSVEESALPGITVAVLPRSGKISLVSLETRVGVGRFEEMLRWGVEGAKVIQREMEEAVKDWAASLAEPSSHLVALFPGIVGNGGESTDKKTKDDDNDDDDMEE